MVAVTVTTITGRTIVVRRRNNDAVRNRKVLARAELKALPPFHCDCEVCERYSPFDESVCPNFQGYARMRQALEYRLARAIQAHRKALIEDGAIAPEEDWQ